MGKTFAKYWLASVSAAGSIVGMVYGLSQGSKLWFVIVWAAIAFAGFMAWKERDKEARNKQIEYHEEIETYMQSLAVEYVSLVEKVYAEHNRMAAIVASDEEIFDSVKREHPKLNDNALREAIRGWRAQKELIIKPLSLS